MSIIILPICFLLLFFNLGILAGPRVSVQLVLLKSVLVFSAILVFITEFLSIFHLLSFSFLLVSWLAVSGINFCFVYTRRELLFRFIHHLIQSGRSFYRETNRVQKWLLFFVFIFLLTILFQGIVYPPNHVDSMTYHLPRIVSWISHASVDHFPTFRYLQIFQPPFAEFVIMHFNMLNGGDYFSNSVQFFFLLFILVALVYMVHFLGLGRTYKMMAIVLAITIPEVILEASSTQNDLVVSFFILTSVCFGVISLREISVQNYFFLGLSVGLGILSKGTAYLFLAPLLLFFAIRFFVLLFKTKKVALLGYATITLLLFLSINCGHYVRNYNLSGNILGIDQVQTPNKDFNEAMTPKLLLSNLVKNAGIHLGPYPFNKIAVKLITKFHALIGVNLHNKETNIYDGEYSGPISLPNREELAPNQMHLLLILLSFSIIGVFLFKNRKGLNFLAVLLAALVLLQVLLFCLVFKWTPWHSRLHTTLFLMSVPLICYVSSLHRKFLAILSFAIPVMMLYAGLIILFNYSRPILSNRFTSKITITDPRYHKYFANYISYIDEYTDIYNKVCQIRGHDLNIGLIGYCWEYPLFCQFYGKNVTPVHLNIDNNISGKIPLRTRQVDCIVSSNSNDSVLVFDQKKFYNQTPKNSEIWLYK